MVDEVAQGNRRRYAGDSTPCEKRRDRMLPQSRIDGVGSGTTLPPRPTAMDLTGYDGAKILTIANDSWSRQTG